MRISDWSSDVCSSDLPARDLPAPANPHRSGGRMDCRSGGYVRRTQEERRQESESRLIVAAVKLIAEKGANGLTLAEVGHEAGYSSSLLGHYFETKEALLARVVEHTMIGRALV